MMRMTGRVVRGTLALAWIGLLAARAHADESADLRALKAEVAAERRALAAEREALAAQRARIDDALLQLQDERAREPNRSVEPGAPAPVSAESASSAAKAHLDIYGFAQVDAIYDIDKMDPDWQATLRPSKIPVNCPGQVGCGHDQNTNFSARQSRFGAKGYVPTPLGELRTIFEFDLFGVGDDAGETTFRLRHAWGELGQFGGGQTWSLFMDENVFPNTIDYWGQSGMVFFRNVQTRWTPLQDEHQRFAVAFEGPGAGIDSGKLSTVDPDLALASWNPWPDFTTQYRYTGDSGHFQISGIARAVGFQNTNGDNGHPSGKEFGWGVNLAGTVNTVGDDQILWQIVYGRAIASYMNDGGVDLAPDDENSPSAFAIPTVGWLVYYNRQWSEKWTSSIGFSEHRQRNTRGQMDNAFHNGQYGNVNILYHPVPEMWMGPEFVWGRLVQNDGDAEADNRFQFSMHYDFSGSMGNRTP